MIVNELIAELLKMPPTLEVKITIDEESGDPFQVRQYLEVVRIYCTPEP